MVETTREFTSRLRTHNSLLLLRLRVKLNFFSYGTVLVGTVQFYVVRSREYNSKRALVDNLRGGILEDVADPKPHYSILVE